MRKAGIIAAMTLLLCCAVQGAELRTLNELVEQWMNLRTTIAGEEQAWEEQREQWVKEIELLRTEQATLRREIDEARKFTSSAETKQAAVIAQHDELQAVLDALIPVLSRSEVALRSWQALIPDSLAPGMRKLFADLAGTDEERNSRPITQRAQQVAALLAQVEQLQNAIQMKRDMLDIGNGQRRQVDIIYIGLGNAFAVSPAGDWAAVGLPCESGWCWTERSELAEAVRTAIRIMNREEVAALVQLPLQITEILP